MTEKMRTAVFIIVFWVVCLSPNVHAQSAKEDLELQAMCSKKAEEFYKKNPPQNSMYQYQCHYNKKLNKCFISIADASQLSAFWSNSDSLYDVFENKSIGYYQQILKKGQHYYDTPPADCEVAKETCKSKEEYDRLVKPYMED